MGPAVFVLRGKYVPQHETVPRGIVLGRKRDFTAEEDRRREEERGQGGRRRMARMDKIQAEAIYKRNNVC